MRIEPKSAGYFHQKQWETSQQQQQTQRKKERKKERKREKQKKGGTSLWFCINPNSSGHVHLNRTVAGWGRKEGKKNFLFAHCQFVDSPKGSFFLEAFQFLFSTIYTFFLREKKNDDNIQLPPEERAATQQQKRDDPQAENKELSLPLYAVTAWQGHPPIATSSLQFYLSSPGNTKCF